MASEVDRHLEEMARLGEADRRNGSYSRWLLCELGEIELQVPRTRTFSALRVMRSTELVSDDAFAPWAFVIGHLRHARRGRTAMSSARSDRSGGNVSTIRSSSARLT